MRDDKVFRKQPVLEGCYSAQPESRLMTLRGRETGPIKYVLAGLLLGWVEVLTGGRAGPSLSVWYHPWSPPSELPTAGSWALEGESSNVRCAGYPQPVKGIEGALR